MRWLAVVIALGLSQSIFAADALPEAPLRVYVGTYTSGGSRGIYLLELDRSTGELTAKGLVAETPNPSFLAIHPSKQFMYAVNEVDNFGGQKAGSISAFSIDAKTGGLTLLNQQSTKGAGPCHLTIDRTGKSVLVANYGGGSVASFAIGADGRLAPASSFIQHHGTSANPKRQGGPHAHSINLDAANRFAVVADLGLDQLLVYRFDPAKSTIAPNDPPFTALVAGGGPRHFAFHPDGRHAFVIEEIKSRAVPLEYAADRGVFEAGKASSTLPEGGHPGNSTAEVQVHPSGKFLYVSNRGHDSIAIFAIDPKDGKLTALGHQPTGGKTPRNFGIDPSGQFLLAANQDSGTVIVFRIDGQTGLLAPTGHTAKVPMPVCVKMLSRD
jgi:6-phosphogluconolactonase